MKKKPAASTPSELPRFDSMVKGIPPIRKFYLQRVEDESGVSGTGIVAIGVLFSSGIVVLHWGPPVTSVTVYHSIADLEKVHGHHGKTQVKWVEGEF
jgi:hypothetical protein